MGDIARAIEYPIAKKIWGVIRSIEKHHCKICDDPSVSERVRELICEGGKGVKEVSEILGIGVETVRGHISRALEIGEVETYCRVALLKIIGQVDKEGFLEKVKAGDIVSAVRGLIEFERGRGSEVRKSVEGQLTIEQVLEKVSKLETGEIYKKRDILKGIVMEKATSS